MSPSELVADLKLQDTDLSLCGTKGGTKLSLSSKMVLDPFLDVDYPVDKNPHR